MLCLAVSTAVAQKKSAPPKPKDSGPSLEATMRFIQDKLSDIGKVNYVIFGQDTSNNTTFTGSDSEEFSNITVSDQCRIQYHLKRIEDGKIQEEGNYGFNLSIVQDVVVEPAERFLNDEYAASGQPTGVATSTNPPITVLLVRRPHHVRNYLIFTDPDLADRVAKAITHAIELCGGGSKDDPF